MHQAGFPCAFEQGTTVARGYADLGYEEFVLLSESKLLSLQSGKISELPEAHRHFFFAVPTVDRMVDQINRSGVDFGEMLFVEQRSWQVALKDNAGVSDVLRATTIEELFLRALMWTLVRHA